MTLARSLRAVVALLALSAAAAHAAALNPRTLPVAGPRSQILVLGTPHLSQMPAAYRNEFLAPLLDRLAAFKPDVITIEALSGSDCEYLTRYKALIPDTADTYCWDTAAARKATGLDVAEATIAVDKALKAWPKAPTAAERRRLAALFLASNNRASAAVQWLRLPVAERHVGDGMDDALVQTMVKVLAGKNENVAIAATLAARLGLERVYPVDDHSADITVAPLGDDYGKALEVVWKAPGPFMAAYKAREAGVVDSASTLAFYRYMNDPATNRAAVTFDMGGALKAGGAPYWGRQYVGWWETRNLRMVANIRQAFADKPGARVLAIVGATHKAYFDAYLGMMSGVTIVDAETVLK